MCEARDANNNLSTQYFNYGLISYSGGTGTNYYFTRDSLSSIREVTDGTGQLISQYNYTVFGQAQASSGVNGQMPGINSDFQYAGYYYHAPSGLNLTMYRAYNPSLARFLTRDPIGEAGGVNLYAYVMNDPVDYIDPSGEDALGGFIGVGIGAGIGGFVGGAIGATGGTFATPGGTILGGSIGASEGSLIGGIVGGIFGGNVPVQSIINNISFMTAVGKNENYVSIQAKTQNPQNPCDWLSNEIDATNSIISQGGITKEAEKLLKSYIKDVERAEKILGCRGNRHSGNKKKQKNCNK